MIPSFSRFRTGTPVPLPSGGQLSYGELKRSGLQEHYIRIVHELAGRGELTRPQVTDLTARAASKDRLKQQAVRAELAARHQTRVAPPVVPSKPGAERGSRREGAEKTVSLVSSGDHKQAVRVAQSYGLQPLPVPPGALRPGQSPEAHTVQAPSHVAGKLITGGPWKSVG